MADLIDRAALLKRIDKVCMDTDPYRAGVQFGVETVGGWIREAPAVDAVPVVRCKDCKHYENHKLKVFENCVRNERFIPMKPNDFCSYGERRTDATD